jgi:glycosyltransferase involved in cell wall biosynthesis
MSTEPFFSVCIPLYNGIEYLEEAIESVRSQTFDSWEILIGVNGWGSESNEVYQKALSILEQKADSRIRAYNYEWKGAAETYNALVWHCKADWIACLDVDDIWFPSKLETQYECIKAYPSIDVVGTKCVYFGDMIEIPNIPSGFLEKEEFKTRNPLINSSLCLRKELVQFENRFNLYDYDLWLRLCEQNRIFYTIPQTLVRHRLHKGSYFNSSGRQNIQALQEYYFTQKREISVIIRLYNGIEFLEEAVQSVLSQIFKSWDLTIGVNGHGPDGGEVFRQALEIAGRLGDPRIRVVNYPNVRGGAQALNALVQDARCPWVAILDADDKWHPQKLEAQWDIHQLHPQIDVIGTWCQYFGERDGSPQIPAGLIDNRIFRYVNPMINSSVLIPKELASFTDQFYGLDDYELWIRLSLDSKIFFNIPSYFTYHRLYSTSSFNASKKQDVDGLRRHYFG